MSKRSITLSFILKTYLVWVAIWKLFAVVPMWSPLDNPKPGLFIMKEVWKDIPDYEGYYQVSSIGNVRSLDRMVATRYYLGRRTTKLERGIIMKQTMGWGGYLRSHLGKNGTQKRISTHRLVAMAFILNPKNKPHINHKNGIKTDNRVENLEWCTPSENIIHAGKIGLKTYKFGGDHHMAKLNEFQVRVIRKCPDLMQKELAIIFNVHKQTIMRIINKKS